MASEIEIFMRSLLDDYKHLRGKPKDGYGKPFWDVLVITTADPIQKQAFQIQIDEKKERQELPVGLPIHVICDPPGIRIGNGGSTLVALETLEGEYGPDLFKKKTLLIHAGGWSQRMPSASILGKAFSLLPHGNPPYQMLDLKLALYWPFVDKVKPGVFLACADDFVVYSLGGETDWEIPSDGFTAMAHPSHISIGRTHGVYVLPDAENLDTEKRVFVSECLEVLQKPDDERMKTRGAVLKGDHHKFADGICVEGEAVYTDSCFYFGVDIMRKLLSFKKSIGVIGCEIDAYGDFLQAVGKNASNSYIKNVRNVSQKTSNLLKMRQGVFDCLNGSDIHVLVLNASTFIHIGTTKEMLYHFCKDEVFQRKLAFEKDIFNAWLKDNSSIKNGQMSQRDDSNVSSDACIMHSAIHQDTVIDGSCVLDFCDFDVPVQISRDCILSNCQLKLELLNFEPEKKATDEDDYDSDYEDDEKASEISIPPDMFIHTVPIVGTDGVPEYVTVYFSINNNLKLSVPEEEIGSLPFYFDDVDDFLMLQGYETCDILPNSQRSNSVGQTTNVQKSDKAVSEKRKEEGEDVEVSENQYSLWNLRLFSSESSMTSSLKEALETITSLNRVPPAKKMRKTRSLFSIADLLKVKDVKAMLKFRRDLFDKIKSNV